MDNNDSISDLKKQNTKLYGSRDWPAAKPRVRFYDDLLSMFVIFCCFGEKEVPFLVPGCPKVKHEGALGDQSRTQESPGLPSRSWKWIWSIINWIIFDSSGNHCMAARDFRSVPNKDLQACRPLATNSALKLQSERKLGLRSPGEKWMFQSRSLKEVSTDSNAIKTIWRYRSTTIHNPKSLLK